jgi:hypothetical protein
MVEEFFLPGIVKQYRFNIGHFDVGMHYHNSRDKGADSEQFAMENATGIRTPPGIWRNWYRTRRQRLSVQDYAIILVL